MREVPPPLHEGGLTDAEFIAANERSGPEHILAEKEATKEAARMTKMGDK